MNTTEWGAHLDTLQERADASNNHHFKDAVAGVIEATQHADETTPSPTPQARGRRLSEVEVQAVPWMWPGRLALGSITIWYGAPGCGKSSAALEYVARVTQGWDNPDGTPNEYPGAVVLACFEDSLEYTVVERLRAAGADLSLVSDLSEVEKADVERGGTIQKRFSLATDLPELAAEVAAMEASLVVLDPMLSMFGTISNFNNQKVGACLDDLKKWAERVGVAVLLIAHATKNGTTLAGGAQTERAARMIFHLATDTAHKGQVIVSNTKNNLAACQSNMAFRKRTDDTIEWVHGEEPATAKKHEAKRIGDLRRAIQARIDAYPERLFTPHNFMDLENYQFATVKTHLRNLFQAGLITNPTLGKYASLCREKTATQANQANQEDAVTRNLDAAKEAVA